MLTLRRAKERHLVRRRKQEVWLTFSPQAQSDLPADGFGLLDEFSENRLPPSAVVVPRPLEEAEVVTYVLSGALAQEDSTGRSRVIQAGEFQRMTTGRRVHPTERNASQGEWAHIFRLCLHPSASELDGSLVQKLFSVAERRGTLCAIASPDGRKGSLRIHQDALICSAILDPGQHLVHELAPGRIAWLHVVRGEATIGDLVLVAGDGVGVGLTAEPAVSFTAQEESEILLVDLGAPPPKPLPSRVPAT
jgi:redox-sensitive bicupin YhaK (pirin superfamily)